LGWGSTDDDVARSISLAMLEKACVQLKENSATLVSLESTGKQQSTGFAPFDLGALWAILSGRDAGAGVCSSAAAETVCSWWLSDSRAAELDRELSLAFPDGCKMLERSSATTFRYRVSSHASGEGGAGGSGLGVVFATLEQMKVDGKLSEYSAGQTTLEQIFNQHASGQENPEVE